MTDPRLTKRQMDVYRLIRKWKHQHGFPPTYAEMGIELGLSYGTLTDYVNRMIDKGVLIRKGERIARGVDINEDVIVDESLAGLRIQIRDLQSKVKQLQKRRRKPKRKD